MRTDVKNVIMIEERACFQKNVVAGVAFMYRRALDVCANRVKKDE